MARRPIEVDWTIKGYRVYRRMPHPAINMYLMSEPYNVYDANSFKVVMPAIHRITPEYKDMATNDHQTVRDIAGETIGRVLAGLNQVFRQLIDNNFVLLRDIYCTYQGRGLATEDELGCNYHLSLPAAE